ncbi:hypothetical protein PENSTE_c008G09467 [Penicillium steckii]|uniref:Pentatricopeptide repeat protein n=1 Tax=Penicillium steckii TaxID=303698 RepID=A0A1V6TC04_9EURO|nr:hypothetical protein PENSTE_c008G09467 [Penicillium steckii]
MFANAANSTPAVPSRNALRVLRQLALAGSTVGGFCTVGVVTYDVHRRVRVAEQIIENKRTLRTSAPNYDATASAKRLAMMMEAAEAGEFLGMDSLKNKTPMQQTKGTSQAQPQTPIDSHEGSSRQTLSAHKSSGIGQYGPFSLSRSEQIKQQAADRVALARELEQIQPLSEDDDRSIERRIRELISKDLEIEAGNIFLRHIHPKAEKKLTSNTRDIARHLFAANCMKGNTFLARTIFERMEVLNMVDSQTWATMMHLLAKEGHVDSVGSIYERRQGDLFVPAYLLEVVLRCLLESRRMKSAKNLFFTRFRDDENGGLCGAFLDGLWRKTRNINLVVTEFRDILKKLANLERSPTEKVFNPLVKAFVENGQYEDAEALVTDMPKVHNVQPGIRTLGLLVYARALSCDWEGVHAGMREIHRLGFTRDKRSFAFVFDRVFLEFYPGHTGREIVDFLVHHVEKFNLVPDKILHRHILEALVERGDAAHIGQINRMAKDRQWNTGVDKDYFLGILNARRVSMQDTPVGVWRMLQAAKKQYGQVASSRRLLGTGSSSYSLDRGVLIPIHKPADETFARTLNDLVQTKPIGNYVPLRKQMESHINGGRFDEALEAFRTAGHAGYELKPNHIHLAVISSLLGHGKLGLADAQIIIKSEYPHWRKGPKIRTNPLFPLVPPVFFQQVLQLGNGASDSALYKMALFEYYNLCQDTPNLTVKHHALASLSKRLMSRKQNRIAINVLTAVYKSTWKKTYGFDHVLFKMLIRAFTHAKDLRGVWWCMMAVLAREEPVHRDFFVEVQSLMPRMEQICTEQGSDSSYASRNIRVLHRLSTALRHSMKGDDKARINQTPLSASKRESRMQVISRSAKEQRNLPSGSVKSMLYQFDAEMELDLLMNGNPLPEKRLEEVWDEYSLLEQHRWLPEEAEYPRKSSVEIN